MQQSARPQMAPLPVSHMVFRSSESLFKDARQFVDQHDGLSLGERRDLLVTIALQFTDESLQAQFLNYLDLIAVGPNVQKAVRGCVSTIKKASEPLIKKLAAGLSEAELKVLAGYIDEVIVREMGHVCDIGYQIPDQLVTDFQQVFDAIRAGQGSDNIEALQACFVEMTRSAYYAFFEKPLGLLQLGMVKRKLTDVGLKVCRSATLTLISSVFKGMPQKELEAIVDYLESMLYVNNQ